MVVILSLRVLRVRTSQGQWHCELAAGGQRCTSCLMRMRAVARATLRIRNELLLLQMKLLLLLILVAR